MVAPARGELAAELVQVPALVLVLGLAMLQVPQQPLLVAWQSVSRRSRASQRWCLFQLVPQSLILYDTCTLDIHCVLHIAYSAHASAGSCCSKEPLPPFWSQRRSLSIMPGCCCTRGSSNLTLHRCDHCQSTRTTWCSILSRCSQVHATVPTLWRGRAGRHVINASLHCLVASSLSLSLQMLAQQTQLQMAMMSGASLVSFLFVLVFRQSLQGGLLTTRGLMYVGGDTGFHHDAKAHSLAVSSDSQTCSGHKWGSALLRTRSGSGFQRGKHCWAFKVRLHRLLAALHLASPPTLLCVSWLDRGGVQVVNKAQSGGVCIGVALQRFDATRKNVGAAPNSWGYSSSGKKVLSPSL